MCGRYYRQSDKQRIAEVFHLSNLTDLPVELAPSYNIAPTTMQPVIVNDRDTEERALRVMRWGLIPVWGRDPKMLGLSTINAKAETLMEKPMWRTPFKKRRCLVPASGFFEWKRVDVERKQPYAFSLKGEGPFAFGGVWEHWKAQDGSLAWDTFSIITTTPNELTATVHDRMPVIVRPSDYDRWLDPDAEDQPPIELLRPYDADAMTAHPVDPRVGDVRNNEPSLCAAWECPPRRPRTPARCLAPGLRRYSDEGIPGRASGG
jgi:putative SOS response-associated peptidase YedK